MVTYEDITDMFIAAAEEAGLAAHPEYWLNTQTLEREFACTLHAGPCEVADHHPTCTVSLAWGPLDTVLSIDGPMGMCEFFHEPNESCPHLQTDQVQPLGLDLSYNLSLHSMPLGDASLKHLQGVMRSLKLNASEHSSRATETQPNVAIISGEGGLQAEALTLQQHVNLPLWDPEGINGFRPSGDRHHRRTSLGRGPRHEFVDEDEPHPEEWLPHLLIEVAGDIARVLGALDTARPLGRAGSPADGTPDN